GWEYHKEFIGKGRIKAQITYYNMAVENWIIWLPQGNFSSPSNIRKVRNQGLDAGVDGNHRFSGFMLTGRINYTYTQAKNQSRINSNDRSFGKQLPYTPLHKIQWNLRTQIKNLEVSLNQVYTGERYDTSDNESVV